MSFNRAASQQGRHMSPIVRSGVSKKGLRTTPFSSRNTLDGRSLGRQDGKVHTPGIEEGVGADEEGIDPLAHEVCKGGVDLAAGACVEDLDLQSRGRAGGQMQEFSAGKFHRVRL